MGPQAGDHQRSGNSGRGKEEDGQPRERGNARFAQLEIAVDQRNDRRNCQEGQPQADADEPQERQAEPGRSTQLDAAPTGLDTLDSVGDLDPFDGVRDGSSPAARHDVGPER